MKIIFAVVSVRQGRAALRKILVRGEKVRVVLEGTLDYEWGHDDGIDQEFAMTVEKVSVKEESK